MNYKNKMKKDFFDTHIEVVGSDKKLNDAIKKSIKKILPNKIVTTPDVKEPSYPYCNKGHRLIYMFSEERNKWVWDCPICINKMKRMGMKY